MDEYYEKVSGGEAARLFGDEFTQEEEDLTGVSFPSLIPGYGVYTSCQLIILSDRSNLASLASVMRFYIVATVGCSNQGNGTQVVQEGISIRECTLPVVDLGSLHWIPLQQNTLLLTMASPHRHRSQAHERRRLRKNFFPFCTILQVLHHTVQYSNLT
jgi:hypothetical protein